MSQQALYLIAELRGYTPQIGRLVSMLNYTRATTLQAVEGLGVLELDYVHDAESNTMGALLAHIAAAEVGYQAATFEARVLNPEEAQQWGVATNLGERARTEIKGHELAHYLELLERVRTKTLAELAARDDRWLDEQASMRSGQQVNNYFKWFHVIGHEIHHRGQIQWLKGRATKEIMRGGGA